MRAQPTLHLDLTNLRMTDADWAAAAPAAAAAVDATARLVDDGKVGFFSLSSDRELAKRSLEWARSLPPEIENLVVLGIGGSSLGPRALYSALARPFDPLRPRPAGIPRRLIFADNVDPATFAAILELCPPERTVWNAISKSGGTVETAAQTMIVADRVRRALGDDGLRRHLVVTTDPDKGALRRIADDLGLTAFDVPPSVGGRFSVLSAVGLVPAAAAGLDVHGLLDGAHAMRRVVERERDVTRNPALQLAVALHQHEHARRPIHVMMPYADGLYDTAMWFQQLWAESLGKRGAGPTPLAVRGATDQHSQLQLFAEGPDDKVILFLDVKERGVDVPIPAVFGELDEYGYLGGHSLGELIDAERRGTTAALTRAGRPNATLTIERLDAPSLGELMLLWEAATAFAGPIRGVDPYDQPGVEAGKRIAFGLLGRKGYEKDLP
jgi:glucose-6-phosphate isomerase